MPILIPFAIMIGAIYAALKADIKFSKPASTQLALVPRGRETRLVAISGNRPSALVSTRRQQLQVMTSNRSSEVSDAERDINRRFLLAGIALIFATLGAFVYFPMSLVSVLFIPYLTWPIWRQAFHSLFVEHRLRVSVLDVTFIMLGLYTGNFFALALGGFLFYSSRKLLIKTEDRSRSSLVNVFGNLPRSVWVRRNDIEIELPLHDVRTNDLVVVHAGEIVPVDGTIAWGIASIDQHVLTGESQPAEKGVGDRILASTVVLSGTLRVRAELSGDATAVAQIGAILQHTADFKSSVQSRGEALADMATPPFLALGAFALPVLGPTGAGAVIGASFGYHLRILAPIGMLNYLTVASRNGILVKDGRSLELLHGVDTVVFDKTGTLTLEQPEARAIHAFNEFTENDILRYAAIAEYKQTHPVAKAILKEASVRDVLTVQTGEAHYDVGYGIRVTTGGEVIRVGSVRYMAMEDIALPAGIADLQATSDAQGASLVYVAIDNQLGGVIALHATIRPEARRVIRALRRRNLSVAIISGDREQPTRSLAQTLGVDDYYAETLPKDKAMLIAQLQREGRTVCFVGDGINDSIALKQANASISLRGASTAATDTAQIILMDQSLEQLTRVFEIAEEFRRTMNFSFAATIVPGLIGLWGAFFLRFGMVAPILLNNCGLAVGLGSAMVPGWSSSDVTPEPTLELVGPGSEKPPDEEFVSVPA